jgi:hypothetical protein
MNEQRTIYVRLLDEGTDVFRPVRAEQIEIDVFKIVAENSAPEDEKWEFSTGQRVRCKEHTTPEGKPILIACELLPN